MTGTVRKRITVLALLSSILAAAATSAGIAAPSLYAFSTPEHLNPGAVSQDVFSLLAAMGTL